MADRLSLVYCGVKPDWLCCDATLRCMPNGEWLCIFLTGGHTEPLPENYVAGCRSTDRGVTWTKPEQMFRSEDNAIVPSEMMVAGDTVTVFLSTHDGQFKGWESWYTVSTDSGYTWSEFEPVPHRPERTFVRNACQKRNGELVLPWQWSRSDPYCSDPLNGVLLSRDGGNSFTCHGAIETVERSWAENNVVELSDGTLAMLIRTDGAGVLFRADSPDGGTSWTAARATDVPNPGTKFRLFGLSDGRIVLIHNPNSTIGVRSPLSMWVSDDDMKSWSHKRDLVTFPGQLAYPDGFVDEKEEYVHFAFDHNRHDVIYVGAKLPDTRC